MADKSNGSKIKINFLFKIIIPNLISLVLCNSATVPQVIVKEHSLKISS